MKNQNDTTAAGNRYVAFLRGVNVKGTNMKMEAVRLVFQQAGMKNVSSVLASGNILFNSKVPAEELTPLLSNAMGTHFDYEAFLFIKTAAEIESMIEHNPFESDPDHHVYCFIGIPQVEQTLMEEFQLVASSDTQDAAEIAGHCFYWRVPKNSTLESPFGKILGRKRLKSSFTSRNQNTIQKIALKL